MTISFIVIYVRPSVFRNGWIRLPRVGYLWNFISVIPPPPPQKIDIWQGFKKSDKINT